MKTSLLYNIISVNYIDKIKAKLLKEDSDIKQTYLEKKQKLEEKLDEETKILFVTLYFGIRKPDRFCEF